MAINCYQLLSNGYLIAIWWQSHCCNGHSMAIRTDLRSPEYWFGTEIIVGNDVDADVDVDLSSCSWFWVFMYHIYCSGMCQLSTVSYAERNVLWSQNIFIDWASYWSLVGQFSCLIKTKIPWCLFGVFPSSRQTILFRNSVGIFSTGIGIHIRKMFRFLRCRVSTICWEAKNALRDIER